METNMNDRLSEAGLLLENDKATEQMQKSISQFASLLLCPLCKKVRCERTEFRYRAYTTVSGDANNLQCVCSISCSCLSLSLNYIVGYDTRYMHDVHFQLTINIICFRCWKLFLFIWLICLTIDIWSTRNVIRLCTYILYELHWCIFFEKLWLSR